MEPLWLFDLPIFTFAPEDVDPLVAGLRGLLEAEAAEAPSTPSSARGAAWCSTPDLSGRPHPYLRRLTRLVVDHVGFCTEALASRKGVALPPHRWGVQGQATILRAGGHVIPSDQTGADWSALWCVAAGDAEGAEAASEAGCVTFLDRRPAVGFVAQALFADSYVLRLQPGMLVIFPAGLQRYVQPCVGERPWICVEYTLSMEPKDARRPR